MTITPIGQRTLTGDEAKLFIEGSVLLTRQIARSTKEGWVNYETASEFFNSLDSSAQIRAIADVAQALLFKHKIEIEEELLSAIAYACVAELTQKIIKKENLNLRIVAVRAWNSAYAWSPPAGLEYLNEKIKNGRLNALRDWEWSDLLAALSDRITKIPSLLPDDPNFFLNSLKEDIEFSQLEKTLAQKDLNEPHLPEYGVTQTTIAPFSNICSVIAQIQKLS